MPTELHPVADAWPGDLFVYEARHQSVVLSAPLHAFLEDARKSGRRPVLITPVTSTISWHVADHLRRADGMWAVRELGGGLVNALSGYEVKELDELWEEPAADARRLDTFGGPPRGGEAVLVVEAFARERATERTRIGALAESLAADLNAGEIEAWGTQEPTTKRWDTADLTQSIQVEMPVSSPRVITSSGGAAFSTSVARTKTGLLENTRGVIPIGGYDEHLASGGAAHLARSSSLSTAMEHVAGAFRPTIVMLSVGHAAPTPVGPGQIVASRWPDQPVAVLIGAWAVRDLQLDLDDLSQRHDVQTMGSRRAPSVLLRLSGPDPVWHQMMAFIHDMDEERIAAALAVDFARLQEND